MARLQVRQITDPGCPFAYSGEALVTALRWRFGDQLYWRIVTIGLAEDPAEYEERGYTAAWMTRNWLSFKRWGGMPFTKAPRRRVVATGRACRAVVAARLESGELAREVLRALHFAWFTTRLMLDRDDALAAALAQVPDLDPEDLIDRLDDSDVEEAYLRDRAEARSAVDTPASVQGKTAPTDDGRERFTAQTLVFEAEDGEQAIAGGRQSLDAYDLLLANFAPYLERRGPAEDAREAIDAFPHGLTTREVALLRAAPGADPDDDAAAAELIELAGAGELDCRPLGDDVLWLPPENVPFRRLRANLLTAQQPEGR
jgi:2-hydroxychromene-2-carboxylate isomerase